MTLSTAPIFCVCVFVRFVIEDPGIFICSHRRYEGEFLCTTGKPGLGEGLHIFNIYFIKSLPAAGGFNGRAEATEYLIGSYPVLTGILKIEYCLLQLFMFDTEWRSDECRNSIAVIRQ